MGAYKHNLQIQSAWALTQDLANFHTLAWKLLHLPRYVGAYAGAGACPGYYGNMFALCIAQSSKLDIYLPITCRPLAKL